MSDADAVARSASVTSAHLRPEFISESALAAAQARTAGDGRVSLLHHHLAGALPLPDESVDVVYSNNLLECVADPNALAREVARVLRPGAQLVVGHWDWDTQVFDAADKELVRRLVHAYADWQQPWMEHADGWMGRRLRGVFHPHPAFDGVLHARVLTNTRYEALWFGHANAQAFRSLVRRSLASAEDYERFVDEQVRLEQEGRYVYSITGYAYVGHRALPPA